jgi:hypothetical protein
VRCHSTTVLGVTRTRGCFHPCQSFLKATQNSFCFDDKRRRGRFACSARSCWRKARFSRIRSWREQKALIIQPMRCRSEEDMADILSDATKPKQRQVIHSTIARSFDEGVGILRIRSVWMNCCLVDPRKEQQGKRQTVRTHPRLGLEISEASIHVSTPQDVVSAELMHLSRGQIEQAIACFTQEFSSRTTGSDWSLATHDD